MSSAQLPGLDSQFGCIIPTVDNRHIRSRSHSQTGLCGTGDSSTGFHHTKRPVSLALYYFSLNVSMRTCCVYRWSTQWGQNNQRSTRWLLPWEAWAYTGMSCSQWVKTVAVVRTFRKVGILLRFFALKTVKDNFVDQTKPSINNDCQIKTFFYFFFFFSSKIKSHSHFQKMLNIKT